MSSRPTVLLALLTLIACVCPASVTGRAGSYVIPALPESVPNTNLPAQSGARVAVAANCSNLQARIDAAQYGETILISPNTTCVGHFVLRHKSYASGWIIIRTAAPDAALPRPGTRIGPSYSNFLPKILTPDSGPAISTEHGAHNYRLVGLEIAPAPSAATRAAENYGLVVLGDPTAARASELASNIVIDRDYIHCSASQYCKRGVELEGSNLSVVDSYISEIHNPGQDTQAIAAFNGPGPFKIVNNFLEAAGENVMFGGADPAIVGITARISGCARRNNLVRCSATSTRGFRSANSVISALAPTDLNGTQRITVTDGSHFTYVSTGPNETTTKPGYINQGGLVPSDITVEHNYFFVPENWDARARGYRGIKYVVKNLFELKNAQRVLVRGNVFDHLWGGQGQSGFAVQLTPRNQGGRCPWCVVQDVTFEYNLLQNIEAGVDLLSQDDPQSGGGWSDFLKRVLFSNNLWMGGPLQVMDGPLFEFLDGGKTILTPMSDVTIVHNTAFQGGPIFIAGDATGRYMSNVTVANNIFPHSAYGMKADDGGSGTSALNQYFDHTWKCSNNVIEGIQSSSYRPADYPRGNFFPSNWKAVGFVNYSAGDYRLSPSSRYKTAASDGSSVGANIVALKAAIAGAVSGAPGNP